MRIFIGIALILLGVGIGRDTFPIIKAKARDFDDCGTELLITFGPVLVGVMLMVV